MNPEDAQKATAQEDEKEYKHSFRKRNGNLKRK